MSIVNQDAASQKVNQVTGLKRSELEDIRMFLMGMVFSKKKEAFSLSSLLGGENYYWNDTPLIKLYEKHLLKGKTSQEAIGDAGRDAGWILKQVIKLSKRQFETWKEDSKGTTVNYYKWVE